MTDATYSAYDITISEEQRVALIAALNAANVGKTTDTDHPLQYWIAMLEALPNDVQTYVDPADGKTKRVSNGFCL